MHTLAHCFCRSQWKLYGLRQQIELNYGPEKLYIVVINVRLPNGFLPQQRICFNMQEELSHTWERFGHDKVWTAFGQSTPCKTSQKSVIKKVDNDDDDDFDLFGEQTEAEKAAVAESTKTVAQKPTGKKKVIDKSTLVIEVKPASLETNLDDIEKEVRQIRMEGLDWAKASKKVPIAFGLNKLQMGCSIIDELVATDDIIERIEEIGMNPEQVEKYRKNRDAGDVSDDENEEDHPGWVQSAEIVSFQKL